MNAFDELMRDFVTSDAAAYFVVVMTLVGVLIAFYLILCILSDWYLARIKWKWPVGGELDRAPLDLAKLMRERRRVPRATVVHRDDSTFKHFDTNTKSCFNHGCTDDCPVSADWRARNGDAS